MTGASPSRTAQRPGSRASLACDARGAIALIGLFMAVFLTAMVAYVVGIGESVLYREQMQDAADAAAFSAAVLHARGMNLIALVNMSMAALLAVLVALKLVEAVIAIALIIIAASAFFAPGLAAAIPPLSQLRTQVQTAHDQLRPPIHGMLEALHAAGVALREVVPVASAARAQQIAGAQPGSPAEYALAVPARPTLPTIDGTFAVLCEQAGNYVGDAARMAIGSVVPGPIASDVSDAITGLARARADWFCGADGAAPPATELSHIVRHPMLPSRERCERVDPSGAGYDAREHAGLCEQAERDEQAAQPQEGTGRCGQACELELYEQRAELGRIACAPRPGRDGLRGFLWQERRFRREYLWSRGAWHVTSDARSEEGSAQYRLHDGDARPCGHADAAVAPEWNRETQDADGRALPLCTNAAPPSVPAREGTTRSVQHLEVTHVFGCWERVRRRYELAAGHAGDRLDEGGGTSSERKVPQVMEDGVELGEDAFQIRAVAIGGAPPGSAARVIGIASWGKEPPSAATSWLANAGAGLGRVALAQAEYFYAVPERDAPDRATFLWSMRWQARLRRFRLPDSTQGDAAGTGNAFAEIAASCSSALGDDGGDTCGSLRSILDLVVH